MSLNNSESDFYNLCKYCFDKEEEGELIKDNIEDLIAKCSSIIINKGFGAIEFSAPLYYAIRAKNIHKIVILKEKLGSDINIKEDLIIEIFKTGVSEIYSIFEDNMPEVFDLELSIIIWKSILLLIAIENKPDQYIISGLIEKTKIYLSKILENDDLVKLIEYNDRDILNSLLEATKDKLTNSNMNYILKRTIEDNRISNDNFSKISGSFAEVSDNIIGLYTRPINLIDLCKKNNYQGYLKILEDIYSEYRRAK